MADKVSASLVLACALLGACSFDTTGVWNFDGGGSPVDASPTADAPTLADAPEGDPDADLTPDADRTPDADLTPDAREPGLVDEGLIVRYYLDEAASGQSPTQVEDSAPAPLPLAVTYTPELTFTEVAGNRGLAWTATGVDSRASVAVDSTKIHSALDGSATGTIELVMDVDDVTSSYSRFSHIGVNQQSGRFTLTSNNADVLLFFFNDALAAGWEVSMPSLGRISVHLVFDSTQVNDTDRIRLYVDGALVPSNGDGSTPALDATIALGTGRHYVLGNREVGGRSFRGELFYAAMYSTALSAADVAQNAEILSADDDSP